MVSRSELARTKQTDHLHHSRRMLDDSDLRRLHQFECAAKKAVFWDSTTDISDCVDRYSPGKTCLVSQSMSKKNSPILTSPADHVLPPSRSCTISRASSRISSSSSGEICSTLQPVDSALSSSRFRNSSSTRIEKSRA